MEATTFAFTKLDQIKKHNFSMMFGVRASMKQIRAGVSFQLHKKVVDSHGHCLCKGSIMFYSCSIFRFTQTHNQTNVKGVVVLMHSPIYIIYCVGRVPKWPGSNHTIQ